LLTLFFAAAAALSSGQEALPVPSLPEAAASPASQPAAPDTTPAQPSPTPLAGDLRSTPTGDAGTGVIRYDPSFFADLRPNTAGDMISRLPGFSLDTGAEVRGFAGAAGNVLVDGNRPTSKQDNLENLLRRIPASQVDHIEVIRGGAPGIDMQGQTVIANVVLKKGGGSTGLIAASDQVVYDGRNLPAVRAEMRKKWDGGRALELAGVIGKFVDDGAGEGPRVRTDANGGLIERADVDDTAGGTQATFNGAFDTPLAGGKFRINGQLMVQTFDFDEADTLTSPAPRAGFLSTERDTQTKVQSEVGLHYERALSTRLNLETLFIQQYNTQDYTAHFYNLDEDVLFAESDTAGETIGRAVLRYRHSDKLQAEVAVEGAYNFLEAATDYVENGAPVTLPAANVKVEEKRGEASGQVTWRPTPKLQVETGMRLELSTISSSGDVVLEKTLTYPKPRVVVTWSPDANNQLRLRGEREVGQLDFRDFVASSALNEGDGTVRSGNPDLVPQRAWVAEAAYERRFLGTGAAVITLRHSIIQDATDRVPLCALDAVTGNCELNDEGQVDYFDAPGNIGDGKETDLILSLTLPLDRIGLKRAQIKGVGTFRHSEVTDPTTGEMRRISGQHPFDYDIHFSHDLPRWKANWGIDVYNRWTETYYRFNAIDRAALKTWVTLFAEWKPQPDLSIRFEANNLGARGFQRTITAYDGPRHGQAPAFVDDRQLDFGPIMYMRVRKTFG
jgi:TonB-dependent receptor-like protein